MITLFDIKFSTAEHPLARVASIDIENEFFSRSRKDCNVSLKQCVGVIDIAQAGSQSCDICSLSDCCLRRFG